MHVVPLKMNLEPEGWLEQDMRLFVNKQWIEVLPKVCIVCIFGRFLQVVRPSRRHTRHQRLYAHTRPDVDLLFC